MTLKQWINRFITGALVGLMIVASLAVFVGLAYLKMLRVCI